MKAKILSQKRTLLLKNGKRLKRVPVIFPSSYCHLCDTNSRKHHVKLYETSRRRSPMKLIAICFSDVSTKIDGKWKYIVAAEWFEQILEGIKAAHQLGIIHRDLKPENLLITRNEKNRPLAKILDFGLAKVTLFDAPPSVSLTGPGTLLGTIYYMSPEQIVGGD